MHVDFHLMEHNILFIYLLILKDIIYLLSEREEGRKRERNNVKGKHQSVASHTPNWGLQPRHVP